MLLHMVFQAVMPGHGGK